MFACVCLCEQWHSVSHATDPHLRLFQGLQSGKGWSSAASVNPTWLFPCSVFDCCCAPPPPKQDGVYIINAADGKPSGDAYVVFKSEPEAKAACEKMVKCCLVWLGCLLCTHTQLATMAPPPPPEPARPWQPPCGPFPGQQGRTLRRHPAPATTKLPWALARRHLLAPARTATLGASQHTQRARLCLT